MEKFEGLLKGIGRLHEVNGDGNCLFRAFAHAYEGNEEMYDEYRQ